MLTTEQTGIIVGMLLGDGCIPSSNQNLLKIWHSQKQEQYVFYKQELIANIFGKKPNIQRQSNKHYSGNVYSTCGFGISKLYFSQIRQDFYDGNKRVIKPDTLNKLTPEGIAIWFMDDGSGDAQRNTQGEATACQTTLNLCKTLKDAQNVIDYFQHAFGICMRIRDTGKHKPEHSRYSVIMNTTNSRLFAELVKPYILPSMGYKLQHVSKDVVTPIEHGKCTCGKPLFTFRLSTASRYCKTCRNKIINAKQAARKKQAA